MRELALHLLDIAENSISARAKNITITVTESLVEDRLRFVVEDDGSGMSPEMIAKVVDPFVTSRTTRKVGLGIPLLKAAAEASNGFFKLQSQPGKGTVVEVEFQRSHIDRMPLGDLASTFITLLIGSPEVHWVLNYITDNGSYTFDDEPVKAVLDGVPLCEPSVIAYIRQEIREGIQAIQPTEPSLILAK
ncbi:MAG TPA: ATP-binding protein [Anaerolineaceae bacterium]